MSDYAQRTAEDTESRVNKPKAQKRFLEKFFEKNGTKTLFLFFLSVKEGIGNTKKVERNRKSCAKKYIVNTISKRN